jgi:toxin FitB
VNFVLDTNAVSETRKIRPNLGFMAWLEAQEPADLFITTITLGEAWLGFHRLPLNHADYDGIKQFVANRPTIYRVLKYDLRAAEAWGEMTASVSGPLPLRDSFIRAIARSRGFRVVTRDVEPFERMGCKVVCPWK